ncbi:MAG TPA: S9 family peptidase [Gemmatimonadaceae bacterium]|nr:S9 family peptidase [Gemmatimonadaceae bacterium]
MTAFRLAGGATLVALVALPLAAQNKRAMTFDDFAAVRAVSDAQIAPSGRSVLYTLREVQLDANRRAAATMLALLTGGAPRRWPDDSTSATEARWSPDGARVAYVAGGQLWIADAAGGNRRKLTSLNGGASGPVWSPTGDRIAFVSAVYPQCADDVCNARRDSAKAQSKVKAYIADELMFRHWNAVRGETRSHLFVIGADGSGLRDLVPGARYDVPPGPFGGSEGYAFSPDGKEVAYTAKDAGREEAWSTDINVYTVPVTGGESRAVTAQNKGADQNPVYSPDGKYLAYSSQARAGFEADRWRLMLLDRATGTAREALPNWDRNADTYFFAPDSRSIYVNTIDRSRHKLYRATIDRGGRVGAPQLIVGERNESAFTMAKDGRTFAWLRDAIERPAEVFTMTLDARGRGTPRQLSHHNDALLAQLSLNPPEEMWYRGAGGDSIQAFVVKPPNWQSGRKYSTLLLIHGGPQSAWLDQWHSRWNYQMFAAPGFGLVIVNPRGSLGYGQRFTDEITKDWSGKVVVDLMNGLDTALARHSWLDSARVGAAGGSYGGYMVNWLLGHSNRFDALISHAGVFNLEHMYGATEELWFPEWEYGGPFWDDEAMREQYRKNSPHLAAKNFKTPTLVLHGELDYRVPYTEGLSLFTTLRRQNIPSRLVVFPDEGHWILKPQNQQLWWSEVQTWLKRYLGELEPRAAF